MRGAIPVLVGLLDPPDTDVQCNCTTALSNIAVDGQSALSYCLGGSLLTKPILVFFRFK